MGDFPRKADGRRVFSPEFKRETVHRILSGEKTIAELSREFDVSPTVIRHWKRWYESGAATAVKANEDGGGSCRGFRAPGEMLCLLPGNPENRLRLLIPSLKIRARNGSRVALGALAQRSPGE